jgi:hypothetical protein
VAATLKVLGLDSIDGEPDGLFDGLIYSCEENIPK